MIRAEREEYVRERLVALQKALEPAGSILGDSACVYVTGSFGRGEASAHSDLDVFIVGDTAPEDSNKRRLSRLDEIQVKADLIRTCKAMDFPDFSGDGEYLAHYTIHDLTQSLGSAHDDAKNTFTARLLLLLESKPLIGTGVYDRAIKAALDAYWGDFEAHADSFIPAFLANDILRLWRTFCVNYEARTRRQPDREKAKRKLKNYKLKHSRLLTCYSTLAYLLSAHVRSGTVTPANVAAMVARTPTERLNLIAEAHDGSVKASVSGLLTQYDAFLATTNAPETELIDRFLDRDFARAHGERAQEFGDAVHRLLLLVGSQSRFYRMLVV
jgi:predicted nucleotidyltransferase